MTIQELRILPPFAIGRLGSASEPLDNYTIKDDPDHPLGFRAITPAETLLVDEASGEIRESRTPAGMEFKDQDGRIRPVAPFLEVFALTADDKLEPLTVALLSKNGLSAANISWRVTVANRKVVRRTDNEDDLVHARTCWFSGHEPQQLKGISNNFIAKESFIDFGRARYIRPNDRFPGIRLRFTPAKGLIYGPRLTAAEKQKAGLQKADDVIPDARAIYDSKKGWHLFGAEPDEGTHKAKAAERKDDEVPFDNETVPPALYAIYPPAPSWLNDNKAVSRGYLDDACDGFVEVRLTLAGGKELTAAARICAGPPALVPDSLFVRSLADDLEQVIYGPRVGEHEPHAVTLARAQDIVRRAYETVRFMNVAVMNGNNFKGRPALSLDSMPEEEAADTERSMRPLMGPGTVDTLAIMALHEQVYAALAGGTAPWFIRLLRRPDEVADYTDRGRRKMPALMCGADNSYLALTYRQIDTIRKAAGQPKPAAEKPVVNKLTPRNLSAQIHYEAAGNPISSRPVTSVANCCPGLEVDFRAVWRRMFKGVVLREHDNLVVDVDPGCDEQTRSLKHHRLLRVAGVSVTAQMKGPASSDPEGAIILTTDKNPYGLAPLEWSNALAQVLHDHKGKGVRCDFSKEASPDMQLPWVDDPAQYISIDLEVRPFFDDKTAVISQALAAAGELTQGLCSPWQNDYRECSCYYWASARPDYVNVEPTPTGLSNGDNWLQKKRSGDYVPDDYADTRLIHYNDLFRMVGNELPEAERRLEWEDWLKFQVGGRDVAEPPKKKDAKEGS